MQSSQSYGNGQASTGTDTSDVDALRIDANSWGILDDPFICGPCIVDWRWKSPFRCVTVIHVEHGGA